MDQLTPKTEQSLVKRVLFYAGAAALLVIVAVETLAVLGRHIGLPLLGAIEIIQAAILVVACTATVITTLEQAHATVHLLTQRLTQQWQRALSRLSAVIATILFGALATGSAWLAKDFWYAFEQSEVLRISFRPLRLAASLAMMVIALIFLARAVQRGAKAQ